MSKTLIEIYYSLLKLKPVSDFIHIEDIPFSSRHKIGVSENNHPIFFLECEPSFKAIDTKLELISILFNRNCQLLQNQKKINVHTKCNYVLIELNSDNNDLQKYFIDIISLIIEKLPDFLNYEILKIEIQKLVFLFSQLNKPAIKQIQGLWAELLLIEQSTNPEYLIKAWHNLSTDKYDFNDGLDKIEIKSTSKNLRIHEFSIEQLSPNTNSNLIIASTFVINTGIGKNIFDLVESINIKTKSLEIRFRLLEIIGQTIGQEFEKANDFYFDYQQAIDSLLFFNSKNIPTIDSTLIPNNISSIRFNCDLSNIEPISKKKLNNSDRLLLKSI